MIVVRRNRWFIKPANIARAYFHRFRFVLPDQIDGAHKTIHYGLDNLRLAVDHIAARAQAAVMPPGAGEIENMKPMLIRVRLVERPPADGINARIGKSPRT